MAAPGYGEMGVQRIYASLQLKVQRIHAFAAQSAVMSRFNNSTVSHKTMYLPSALAAPIFEAIQRISDAPAYKDRVGDADTDGNSPQHGSSDMISCQLCSIPDCNDCLFSGCNPADP